MDHYCEDCGELVCSCFVVEQEKEEKKPFRFEYAFESITEQGQTQFHRIYPTYE